MGLYGHNDSSQCGTFSLDGKFLISASNDHSIKIWELKAQTCKYTIKGYKFHKSEIICLCKGSKKNIVASGSSSNEIAIVNYDTGYVRIIYIIDIALS